MTDQIIAIRTVLADPARWKQYPDLPYDALIELAQDQTRVDLYRAVMASAPEADRNAVFKALSKAIRRDFADRVRDHRYDNPQHDMLDVIQFNNHPDTTHADILHLLERSTSEM